MWEDSKTRSQSKNFRPGLRDAWSSVGSGQPPHGNYQVFNLSGERWRRILIASVSQGSILIGNSPGKEGIVLRSHKGVGDVQVCVHHIERWRFIAQRLPGAPLRVNGVECPFAITLADCPVQVSVGIEHFLIIPNFSFPSADEDAPAAELRTSRGTFEVLPGKSALIGSHELCGIRLLGEEFMGITYFWDGSLWFLNVAARLAAVKRRATDLTQLVLKDLSARRPVVMKRAHHVDLRNNETLELLSIEQQASPYRLRSIPLIPDLPPGPISLLSLVPPGEEGCGVYGLNLPEAYPEIVVGREQGADLKLDDESVSRRHACLRPDGNTVRMVDLGSTNGVYVNGARVSESVIHPGDFVNFGDQCFLVGRSDVEGFM